MAEEIKPFPREWLTRYTYEELERLAILTVDNDLTDEEAILIMENSKYEKEKANGK